MLRIGMHTGICIKYYSCSSHSDGCLWHHGTARGRTEDAYGSADTCRKTGERCDEPEIYRLKGKFLTEVLQSKMDGV